MAWRKRNGFDLRSGVAQSAFARDALRRFMRLHFLIPQQARLR